MKKMILALSLFLTICMGIFTTTILYSAYKLWDNGFFESELVEYHYRLNGRDVYSVEYQSDFDKFYDKPILLALHGSQRSSENYKTKSEEGVNFYIHQKEKALENNYRFLSISLDTDVWGNQDGIESLKKLYQLEGPRNHYDPRWTLWATSAGGVNAYRMIAEQSDLFQKMIGTFPVYDTAQMTINNPRANSYWDRYYNPADHPEKLSQANFLIFHGRDDDIVDLTLHSARLKNDLPENTTLIDTAGGHSTDNFYVYNDDLINEFLNYDIQLQEILQNVYDYGLFNFFNDYVQTDSLN